MGVKMSLHTKDFDIEEKKGGEAYDIRPVIGKIGVGSKGFDGLT